MDIQPILDAAHRDTLRALLAALDLHVPGEGGHADRVTVYSVATGEKLGMTDEELVALRRAAMLHDVGKISVPKTVLGKLGELTEAELAEIRQHAHTAETILDALPWMQPSIPYIRHHHERWDGTGYPDGLKGSEIPIGARVIAVAETFDHLRLDTGWRKAMSEIDALDELRRNSGTQFDPMVLQAFFAVQPLIQPVVL